MKKIISLCLAIIITLPILTSCGKDDSWTEGEYVDIIEETEQVDENVDLNLTGQLYTKENRPENSEEIIVYTAAKDKLKVEAHTSYALPDNINIQYLLDTIEAFSAGGNIELTGYVIGDTANVNIDSLYDFLTWLSACYPNDTEKYSQTPVDAEHQDVRFYAHGFAMVAMEIIDRTLKENLGVTAVVFKTNNDEEFLSLGGDCEIDDGIYFTEDSSPRYLGSIYNYIGEADFDTIVADYSQSIEGFAEKSKEEQLDILNNLLF